MTHKHVVMMGALALCGSLLAAQSSFAAKQLNDSEMDGTTAAGQPRIAIGNGQQTLLDGSLYAVTIDMSAQMDITGNSVVNAAGENNVAIGMNVANVDAAEEVLQDNAIDQTRNASLELVGVEWSAEAANISSRTSDDEFSSRTDDSIAEGDIKVDGVIAAADHIKIGHGDQTEEDNSVQTVDITDDAQMGATVFSMVNAAGRNQIAVALNAANSDAFMTPTGGAAVTMAVTQSNVISQNPRP